MHSLFAYWRNIVQFIRILYWKYFSRFVDNNVRKSVSDVDHCCRIYIPCLIKEFSLKPLSLPSIGASLCLREAGEREKWKRGAHDGKRKERKPFSSSYRPPCDCYSFTSVIFIGVPSGSLCGTDSTNQAYKGALTCYAVVNCVVYSHWVINKKYTPIPS